MYILGEDRRGSFRPSGPSPAGTEAERRFMGDKVLEKNLKQYQTIILSGAHASADGGAAAPGGGGVEVAAGEEQQQEDEDKARGRCQSACRARGTGGCR